MVERPPHSKAGKLNKPPTDKPTFQRFSGSFRESERTVIRTNVPESGAPSLQARHEEEKQRWNEILKEVGLNLPAVNLTRLSRPPISPHASEPRLLRVTLESMSAVEEVLLTAHRLRLKQSPISVCGHPVDRANAKTRRKVYTSEVEMSTLFLYMESRSALSWTLWKRKPMSAHNGVFTGSHRAQNHADHQHY
ncbi:hypothetical protein P879_03012 [Paragonimus westermani]|uniref:Uncharacterized protein n=1 Tax=Paragonimus westermani TaxID=34504 RepID=A0A8T0CZ02_9TREM|nr:hypothetical protein P879_03012 [Paragonimus westermani]